MKAQCLTIYNPFDPLGSRVVQEVRRPLRLRRLAPPGSAPCIAVLNGRPILRSEWRRRMRPGDQLVFCILPRGGGGQGGSNPLRMLLMLALTVLAPQFGGWLLGDTLAGTAIFGSFTWGNAVGLAGMLVGQAVINALMPMPTPKQLPSASPTYAIGAQGNIARIEQAIPVQYGRLLAWPDFAAQPYAEYAGNDQYLYQLLCLGCGEFDIEQIRIEDTPIANFSEITYEVIAPHGQVTLFPTNVISSVEVSGQELPGRKQGTYVRSGTTITVTETAHGRAVGQAVQLSPTTADAPTEIYAIATVPTADTFTVVAPSGSGSGVMYIRTVVGGIDGFIASDAGTLARRLAVDIIWPLGLFDVDGSGNPKDISSHLVIQARRVDDNGLPISAWYNVIGQIVTDRTVTPKAMSYDCNVPAGAGRYRVRAYRIDAKSTASNTGHQMIWSGLRCYLAETQDFGNVTLIAMRMRATNNLSAQASRRIGVVCTRKIPVWNGVSWSAPVASRSIAWAIADAARNAEYGAGLPDTRLDLAALLALDALWTARGDTFNGRFDSASNWWEAVSKIALVGRARLFMQGGRLRVVRDGPQTLPVALYSMRNIKKGSFSIDYLLASEQTADALEVSYFDEVKWSPRRVKAALAGSSLARPVKMELFGATNRDQVYREGLYHAAANKYRRRMVHFATEMEGFIPSIGDLIAIQHDMPGWGAHAEAVAWDAGTRTLTLTEPMIFGAGSYYIGMRTAGGGVSGPWLVTAGPSPEIVVLTDTPDMTPYTGSDRERTHVVFGKAETWRTLAKVTAIKPRGLYEVGIDAVTEDPSVHTADTGVTAAPIVTSILPRVVTIPIVTGLMARRIPGDNSRAVLAWRPAVGAVTYQVEMAPGIDPSDPTVSWTRTADTTATNFVLPLLFASQTLIRVRGTGLTAGPWMAAALGTLIPNMWNTDATAMWTLNANPMWSS
ncbi:host specificity factor TipJ family phage tail protein [Cypionkella psychrotolerans]|uniref:host specificity factor TipJ family phage tail protein n=1 Tax=Cypionkella psychrotolerans TaxID=1678131 RepID=UPI0006B41A9D|nr:host specificity factor TipJ family phage tail protein [Cypionkella psychrotolerans]